MTSPPDNSDQPSHPSGDRRATGRRLAVEQVRFISIIGASTALLLSAVTYMWALAKGADFVRLLVVEGLSSDKALVKLFESIDSILIATVLLIVGFGLWELFVHDLDLPPSLTTTSFGQLKRQTAGTLLLVLVVRFLEVSITRPEPDQLIAQGVSTALVGGLLIVFATWHRSP
ncbi:YqhA family protein [Rhodococcus sp. 077-4]|uniref:YqhA family protein n=1 Tax=Rhodococcus sp. 077-4 TaxID=2789271 RepID=UPI0039F47C22